MRIGDRVTQARESALCCEGRELGAAPVPDEVWERLSALHESMEHGR